MSETLRSGAGARPQLPDDASAAVAERSREVVRLAILTSLPYAAGAALLYVEPWTWSAGLWAAVVVLVITGTAFLCWQFGTESGRRRNAGRLLSEYAVLRHVDPGPGRREPADRRAAEFARSRVLGVIMVLCVTLPAVVGAEWSRFATSLPGAALLVFALTAYLLDCLREAHAGRRWLADPPGPPRD